jgi:hypothetical protein
METPHEHVQRLLRDGLTQLAQGKRREAHRLLRQAAALEPTDIRIWRALLEAVDNNADRRACLENIVNLDPSDKKAVRRLLDLGGQLPAGISTPRPSLANILIVALFWLAVIACVITLLIVLI